MDGWGQAPMAGLSGSAIRVTPGKDLARAVKLNPDPAMCKWERSSCLKCLMMKSDEVISILIEIPNCTGTGYCRCSLHGDEQWGYAAPTAPGGLCSPRPPPGAGLGGRTVLHTGHHPSGPTPLTLREEQTGCKWLALCLSAQGVMTRGYLPLRGQQPVSCQWSICAKTPVAPSGSHSPLYVCPHGQE